MLVLGMEARRDGPGRPFETHYHKTPTHIFLHDLGNGSLEEIATKDRIAPFQTPALLLPDAGRMLVQVVRDEGGNLFSMNLDGSDAREFTKLGEGLPYGLSASPDGRRVAFHLAGPQGYQVLSSAADGSDRRLVAADPDLLYFGPTWSPDGEWLAFQGCRFKEDPGHDWADLWIARPDGSERRALTEGNALWFGASYGPKDRPGGGSNIPSWTRDGRILCSRRLPGSKVPWEFQPNRPDVDHFNRDFRPESASGGSEVCRIDPFATNEAAGAVERLTRSEPPVWDFRGVESPDGRVIAFCRAAVGESPALWTMRADGSGARRLTDGIDGSGADHPRWLPLGAGRVLEPTSVGRRSEPTRPFGL